MNVLAYGYDENKNKTEKKKTTKEKEILTECKVNERWTSVFPPSRIFSLLSRSFHSIASV